jgi:hypothetical protein
MTMPLTPSVGVLCFGVALIVPFSARAQSPEQSTSQKPDPIAVALFEEARRLIVEGKCAEAIPKLQESLEHARTVGALLNLADCYANFGRTASAWTTFRLAATTPTDAKDTKRSKYATERADALEAELAARTGTRRRIHVAATPRGVRQTVARTLRASPWARPRSRQAAFCSSPHVVPKARSRAACGGCR